MGSNPPSKDESSVKMAANNQDAPSTNLLSLTPINTQETGHSDNLSLHSGRSNVSSVSIPSNASSSRIGMNRRQPKNLQSLLNFAMQATQAEDAPGRNTQPQENIDPLNEQRRKFLENALMSLTVNVSEVLENAITVLTNMELINSIKEEDELPAEVRNAFTVLLDHVDDLDVANDFYKMGGFAMFPMCYSSPNAELRSRASSVLGTCCQNNPFCQERAMNSGLLPVLLSLLQIEKGTALAKCLYALSCTCRGYEPACNLLIKNGVCPVLVDLLNSPYPAATTKAAFLIRNFCQNFRNARKQFLRANIVKVIAERLRAERSESTEHLLSILEVLVTSEEPNVLRLCRDQRYDLKKTLEDHLNKPEMTDSRYLEEKQYCQDLLSAIFARAPYISGHVDFDDR